MNKHVLRFLVVSGLLLLGGRSASFAAPEAFEYVVDDALEPAVAFLPGIGEGPERPVAAVLEPDGTRGDYVANEVILHDPSPEHLDRFIEEYGGEIVYGEVLPDGPYNLPLDRLRPEYAANEDFLLRVDVSRFDFNAELFVARMLARDHEGRYTFSSEEGLRLLALTLEEQDLHDLVIDLNPLLMPPPQPEEVVDGQTMAAQTPQEGAAPASADCVMCRTEEYPITGGYANAFTFTWLNDADVKATRAWQFYDLLGLSSSTTPVLAMVDVGFALNADFPEDPPQYDFVDDDYTTNGNPNTLPSGGTWHGTGTLGLAAARLNNRFGTAGTGGQRAYPYLFRPEGTLYGVAEAIRTAVYWGADVVNVSAAAPGGSIFQWLALVKATEKAAAANVIVLVTAGNNGGDGSNYYPCNTPGVLCVGGFDLATNQAHPNSNHGAIIAVWGPYTGLQTTPNPASGGALANFGGTCGASAYTAGVVTLMRTVKPNLTAADAAYFLRSTATNPANDPKLVNAGGILNAYGAVKAAATAAGRSPLPDSYEPNNTAATASALLSGTSTATIAPADVDYYTFQVTDLVDLDLSVAYDDRASPGNGLNARLDDTWGTAAGGVLTLDQALLTPGAHTLSVWGQAPETINCYHIEFHTTPSSITADLYDDQTPAGEPRNDTFAARAVIPGVVEDSVLGPMGQIADLNFDVLNDVDYFEIQLDSAIDPDTGWAECIGPSHPDYGAEGFTQGSVEISAWPDNWVPTTPGWDWPFVLTLYRSDGSLFTTTTGLRLKLDCPHQHFADGKIRFSLRAKDGQRNFYRAFIHYARWNVFYDVPDWVWTLTDPPLVRVLPPWGELIEFTYPRDPFAIEQWSTGNPVDPVPTDFAFFTLDRLQDLDILLLTRDGATMNVVLYNANQDVLGEATAGGIGEVRVASPGYTGEGHIHVPDLEPGTYVLAFQGDFGAVYAVSVGRPHSVYLPLVLCTYPGG